MKHYKIKLTDKFSGVRLVTVTAKTAGEAMDLVDRSEGENIAVIEELVQHSTTPISNRIE